MYLLTLDSDEFGGNLQNATSFNDFILTKTKPLSEWS